MQAVYRAVGYHPQSVDGVPFDETQATMPNDGGHVLANVDGEKLPGLYTTGWIKRGPVGLIGNTKSDAKDTTTMLIADYKAGDWSRPPSAIRRISWTSWLPAISP